MSCDVYSFSKVLFELGICETARGRVILLIVRLYA
jgi:hypothetical protein